MHCESPYFHFCTTSLGYFKLYFKTKYEYVNKPTYSLLFLYLVVYIYHQAGIWLMRGPRLIQLWGAHTILGVGENRKVLIKFRTQESENMDAFQVRSTKNFEILARVTRDHCFVACHAKAFMTGNCCNRTWLPGTRFLICTGALSDNVTVNYITKHISYIFHKFDIYFFLSFLINMPIGASRLIHFAVVWRKLKSKQITTKSSKRDSRHKKANKAAVLLRIRRHIVILLVVTLWFSVIYHSGWNFPK